MSNKKPKRNAFLELTQLLQENEEKRETFDVKEIIDMREKISLTLFYLSDPISRAYAEYEEASYNRKRNFSQLVADLTGSVGEDGKKIGVTLANELARVKNEEFEKIEVESLRAKDRARIVLEATKQILNAISSRMSNIKPNY